MELKLFRNLEPGLKVDLVQGVYYLPGLDADPEWQKSDLPAWKSAIHQRVEVLFDLMKVLPEKAFLLTGTRMGGLLGLLNPINPDGRCDQWIYESTG